MSRYIDADDIEIAKFQEENLRGMGEHIAFRIGWNEAIESILENASSIDIVRCDECQYYEDGHCESAEMWQSINGYTTECESMSRNADDFCSYGEREGE